MLIDVLLGTFCSAKLLVGSCLCFAVVPNVLSNVLFGTFCFVKLLIDSCFWFVLVPNVLIDVLFGTSCFAKLLIGSCLCFVLVPNVCKIALLGTGRGDGNGKLWSAVGGYFGKIIMSWLLVDYVVSCVWFCIPVNMSVKMQCGDCSDVVLCWYVPWNLKGRLLLLGPRPMGEPVTFGGISCLVSYLWVSDTITIHDRMRRLPLIYSL